jgi:hypothetical protein
MYRAEFLDDDEAAVEIAAQAGSRPLPSPRSS